MIFYSLGNLPLKKRAERRAFFVAFINYLTASFFWTSGALFGNVKTSTPFS